MSTLPPASHITQHLLSRFSHSSATVPLPAVFLSHGSPMTALSELEDPYPQAIRRFFRGLPRPRAIVVVSAHGLSPLELIEVSSGQKPELVYDFGGFPAELYRVKYPCVGEPVLAQKVADLAQRAGFTVQLNEKSRLDHGVWVPLMLAYPDADIPVVQVSLPYGKEPHQAMRLGQALAPLRREGVLLIGSGGMVHNLGQLTWHAKWGDPAPWALEFENWVQSALREKEVSKLLGYAEEAPHADRAHPTPDHFFPLFFTLGCSLPGDEAWTIYEGFEYQTLSMCSFCLA